MAKVPIGAEPVYYTLEYRHATGWDAGIGQDTVLIHFQRPTSPSYLVLHAGGDGAWLPGQTFTDAQAHLRFTVEAIGQLDGVNWAADVAIEDTGVTSAPQLNVAPTLQTSQTQVRPAGGFGVTGHDFAQAANSTGNLATVYLDGLTPTAQLARAALDRSGGFSTTVTLPASVSRGTHVLIGVFQDQTARASIQVVDAAQALQPRLTIAGNQAAVAGVEATMSYPVHGEGFAAGRVSISLDRSGVEIALVTAIADADGAFTIMARIPDTFGNYQLTAQQVIARQLVRATLPVFVQPLPR
jgi:hypothetical protein